MNTTTALTHKGYSIRKDAVAEADTKEMLEELTVCPKVNAKYMTEQAKEELTFKVYRESATRWYLPRRYGETKFGPAEANLVSDGLALDAEAAQFAGTPFPYQVDIINSFLKAGGNGLICVPCGRGKTFMALNIAARIGKRFLVVVDKEFLMNQWRQEMKGLMPNLRIGILQGPRADLDPAKFDCTICMIQTVAGRDFNDSVFRDYGFAIFDECHHLGAQHFSKALQKIQVKQMLGLSATPKREDGLTKVFFWHLGEPVYWEKKREPDPTVIVRSVMVEVPGNAEYNDVPVNWRGEPVMARLLTNILACDERTSEIVRWVKRLCAEAPERKVLVLSERIGHLNEIEVRLSDSGLSMSYYVGGMKEKEREEGAATARVLLASYAMASEAMNIKTLNAVILASPRKAVEQSTGRILRIRASERVVAPVIVDIVDVHSMYRSQWRKRLAYYRQCAYKLESWDMGGEQATKVVEPKAPAEQEAVVTAPGGCMISDD